MTGPNRLLTLLLSLALAAGLWAAPDPDKIVGPEKCAACHQKEVAAWEKSKHFHTFDTLHRQDAAKTIAEALSLKSIKREALCMNCHYTAALEDGNQKAVSGISCESCHGAARDWLPLHNLKEKRAEAIAAGFNDPKDLYAVASNCYSCHTVPFEDLVNKGGHQPGSKFELLSWANGEVRHHYLNGATNPPPSKESQRLYFVLGQALDLEYGLRGLAKATSEDTYAVAMAKRADAARKKVVKLNDMLNLPELAAILVVAKREELKLNNAAVLEQAAKVVGEQARLLVANYGQDSSKLAALDPILEQVTFKGEVAP
jgi:hypothetical protein